MRQNLLIPFAILILMFTLSCSATNRLSMTVTEPAAVSLPGSVQRVGIIDRSQAAEGGSGLAKIDAILSAEGMKLDKEGAQASIEGLADRLKLSGRFQDVVILDSLPELKGGLKDLPASLSRKQIETLCETYGLDAVFSLAFYDTDTRVHAEVGLMEVPNDLGLPIKVPAHQLDLETSIRSGWRIYLPDLPLSLDEVAYRDLFRVSGKGINPVDALNSIAFRKDQVLERSRRSGYGYGGRLEPARVRVGREYFVRGSDMLARGKRLAQSGDWDGAAALWEREVDHPKTKVAGRAHHNMAIINEINGNLDAATDWAREAYTTYGTREALQYLRVLQNRQAQQQALTADLTW